MSRGSGAKANRVCRNAKDVERYFADRGYTVVYPEDLSLAHQVATFREARVVAGFGGSAMFNLMYAEKLEVVSCSTRRPTPRATSTSSRR